MTVEASAPSDGAVSIDAAAGLLAAAREPETDNTPAAAAGADDGAAAEAGQAENELQITADPEAGADDLGVEGEGEEPALPAIPAPRSWDAQAQAYFAQLPPELQQTVVAREGQRDQAVAQAQERTAAAEREASSVTQLRSALDQLVPQARQVFADRWQGINWTQLAQDDAGEYVRLKALHDEDRDTLQRLQVAQQVTQQQEFTRFLQVRETQLPTTAPALCDPKEGPKRRDELAGWLVSSGVPADMVRQADATLVGIAWKAFQYDQAQARVRANPNPAANVTPLRPVRPAGAPASSRQNEAQTALNRLSQTHSVDDAVAALRARRK